MGDTNDESLRAQTRRLRAMAPSMRLDAMRAQTRLVVSLADADVRRRHPDWTDAEVRRSSARRWLSPGDYQRWLAATNGSVA